MKIKSSYTVVHWYEQSIKTRKKELGENTKIAWDKKKRRNYIAKERKSNMTAVKALCEKKTKKCSNRECMM